MHLNDAHASPTYAQMLQVLSLRKDTYIIVLSTVLHHIE